MVPSLISASESNAPSLPVYTLTANQLTVLNAGGPVSDIRKAEKGRINVFGAIDIYQNAESIWAVMIDCDAQLNIIPKLKSCEILDTHPKEKWDARKQVVKLGFPLPNVRSEFRSDYTPFERIDISGTGGDLSYLKGEWRLTSLSDDRTRLTYRAQMKSRLPVPRSFVRDAVRKDMPLILNNLKRLTELESP